MVEKADPVVSLLLEPARHGGYMVSEWLPDVKVRVPLLAGSLRECLEYMAKHFGAEASKPNLRPVS